MPDIPLPFDRKEYADRLTRVRRAMDAAGHEVLIVSDPSNMAWLTGYDGWSFYVHQAVIVGPTGEPVYWGRRMDAAGALRTCYMAEAAIVDYADDYVMNPPNHAMDHLAQTLAARGWAGLRVATEHENYYYSARAHAVLTAALGRAPADATGLVNWARAVKSPAEIRFMRRAMLISEAAQARAREIIRPGLRGNDLAAEIYRVALTGGEDADGPFGGDYPAIVPLLPAGQDASAAHLTWSEKEYAGDRGVFFELSGCYRRYHAPLCRTVYLGTPPKAMLSAEAAVVEGIAEALAAARPGNTAGDVARALFGALARHGVEKDGRCGYPVGLSYPPDWGERTFSLRPSDETVLAAGMTIHLMPAIWTPDWGLEITETILVRDGAGAEAFSTTPRKLFVKENA